MSAWENFLDSLVPQARKKFLNWLNSRPGEIRSRVLRFPPGTTIYIQDKTAYIVGYAETKGDPGYLFSFVNPLENYEEAVRTKKFICGKHLEG